MGQKLIALFALMSFAIVTILFQPAMGQNRNRPANNLRTATSKLVAAPVNMATLLTNDLVSVGPVHADRRKKTFYWPGCPRFEKVPLKDREIFGDDEEAERAGYKPAKDCKQ